MYLYDSPRNWRIVFQIRQVCLRPTHVCCTWNRAITRLRRPPWAVYLQTWTSLQSFDDGSRILYGNFRYVDSRVSELGNFARAASGIRQQQWRRWWWLWSARGCLRSPWQQCDRQPRNASSAVGLRCLNSMTAERRDISLSRNVADATACVSCRYS